jgi:hypothetical protein
MPVAAWEYSGAREIRRRVHRTAIAAAKTLRAGNIDRRYFTQHLKAEAGVMWTTQRYFYYQLHVPTNFPYTSTSRSVQPTTFSGAMTYQFLKMFSRIRTSPLASDDIVSEGRRRMSIARTSAHPLTSSSQCAEARPFVAAGYKSYFNERVYMGSEISRPLTPMASPMQRPVSVSALTFKKGIPS